MLCLFAVLSVEPPLHAQIARLPVAPEPDGFQEQPFELADNPLDSITRRLEALEDENRSLRSLIEQQTEASETATDGANCVRAARSSHLGCTSCTDSRLNPCEGLPDLCDACFEKTSWNKAGGWRVIPFGRLRGDFIYSTAPYTNDTIIAFLNPETPGVSEDATAVSAKQSQINFAVSGPSHNGWDTDGIILINFMGAQPLRNFSGANIVLANAQIANDRWRFAFGRMFDLFGPLNPETVNQIQQRGGGNIGIYRGAFHVDRYLTMSDVQKWTLSSRISQPDITDYAAVPLINGQNNGWPNIEARIGVELGQRCDDGCPVEIGVSGVVGELQAVLAAIAGGLFNPPADEIEQTRGVCLDAQLRGRKLGFRGEAWWGKAAGTYFVAVLQSINPETDQAIESVGGCSEVKMPRQ